MPFDITAICNFRTPVGNISVIVENSDLKDDDDAEDMVVMEAKGNSGDFLENGDYKIDNQLMQEHGHLVAQILETQRELVNTDNVDVLPKKVDIVRINIYCTIISFTYIQASEDIAAMLSKYIIDQLIT